MKTTILYVHPGGVIQGVNDDTTETISESIGTPVKRRASHVWPIHPVKRAAFRFLRSLVGERGRIAEWCRRWHGPWEVRFVDPLNHRRIGAVVFSHPSRRVCIDWEIKQLNRKLAA
jgi:hypothetical protein